MNKTVGNTNKARQTAKATMYFPRERIEIKLQPRATRSKTNKKKRARMRYVANLVAKVGAKHVDVLVQPSRYMMCAKRSNDKVENLCE